MKIKPSPRPFRYDLGPRGETMACRYLKDNGFKIRERNYRCAIGEMDLIAEKAGRIHFVEVKTRDSVRFGKPEEAVDKKKQTKLCRVAAWYLKKTGSTDQSVSIDVISISLNQGSSEIRFIPNAVELRDE